MKIIILIITILISINFYFKKNIRYYSKKDLKKMSTEITLTKKKNLTSEFLKLKLSEKKIDYYKILEKIDITPKELLCVLSGKYNINTKRNLERYLSIVELIFLEFGIDKKILLEIWEITIKNTF